MGRPRIYKDAKTSYKAKIRWINNHNKEKTTAFTIRFQNERDSEVIAWFKAQKNKSGCVRDFILNELKK